MNHRKEIGLQTKLAAALLALGKIDYGHAKQMTAKQICSLYSFDHYPIRYAEGGPTEPWNLVPRLIPEHREKTAKVDVPQIAKARRLSQEQEAFRRRLLAKDRGDPRPASRWPKRKFRGRQ